MIFEDTHALAHALLKAFQSAKCAKARLLRQPLRRSLSPSKISDYKKK
jgi:hypothetical protein